MVEFAVVMDKLSSFDTADDLADFFRGYGIKAQPRNARACAISQFVTEETGLKGIVTNTTAVTVYTDEMEQYCSFHQNHTEAMMDFVERYDMGYYPDLIQNGYEYVVAAENLNYCE